ncbi:MAG: ABC transporter substrate-binding protein [Pseudodesulfovibrio sp.]|uniref:ABC transporter substrate-binding protein n=1 Tax=Pseudodesulfovibrio sp. TaxID=2035812 RepID=UPI003D0EACCB
MLKERVTHFRLLSVFALAWVLFLCGPALAAEVLLLHSGSGPTPWNQRLASGLIEGLGSAASVRQAFLKANGTDEDAYDDVYRRLSEALAGDAPGAVVAEGPVAFAFARKYLNLFPDAPLIFCAMARPDPGELAECGNCTGLSTTSAVRENVDLIFAMRPDTRLVVAITDRTPGSDRLMERVNQAMRPYLDRAQIMFPGFEAGDDRGLDLHGLGDTLASVPSTGAVLFLGFSEDRDGNPVSDEELATLIRERAASPVYMVSDAVFGSGAVGGWMIPAKNVGADAARVALRVLGGEDVREMLPRPTKPVLRFDGTALARYGLKAPDKAELINPPAGKVEERPILPVTGLAWAVGLAAAIALIVCLRRRYRA